MIKRIRVLIVDDDSRNIRILYEILEDSFELFSACDGESALALVEKIIPDIILLDIMMPGIDGYEVCETLKQSDRYRNIKIILVSGKSLTEERIKGYEVGADDFIVKPFDIDEIYAKVKVFAKLKSLEEINKLKTDFLNLINHETGTPLNHIIGTADLLLMDDNLDSNIADSIRDINHAAHNLNDKIGKILFLSRLKQMTNSDIDYMPIDIDNMIVEVFESIGGTVETQNSKYKLEAAQSIKADVVLIHKLLLYAVTNAIDISESTIFCRTKCLVNQDGVLGILIEIESGSSNLTDSELENFFDPFYVDDLMLHSEGLNTTMAICSEIILLHSGSIEINRNSVTGTCLMMWLPEKVVG